MTAQTLALRTAEAPAASSAAAPVRIGDSTPERLGLLGLGMSGAAFCYPTVSSATGFGLPCPLRSLTGIPCPLCGMTTAATSLAGGRLRDALAANPFVLLIAAATAVMAVIMVLRLAGALQGPRPWSPAARQRAINVVTVLAALSWVVQLHRFGWI